MNPAVKVAAYAGVVALTFGAAFAAGAATDPGARRKDPPMSQHDGGHKPNGSAHGADGHDSSGDSSGGAGQDSGQGSGQGVLPGLTVSARGYTLRPHAITLPPGVQVPFTFTVTGPDGRPVREYRPTHEKELHLIVVRRDLSGFQHVHPTRAADGTWSVPLNLPAAGTYRVFADFAPAALAGQTLTLGADAFVAGPFTPVALPTAASTATVDGYEVRLAGSPQSGAEAELTFTVTRSGVPVRDLQPYLGAFGHLVSLRVGDLAYLHTHPAQEARPGQSGGPEIRFATTFPTAGSYRLFLDFQHAGSVHTAAFTVVVPGAGAPSTPTSAHGRERGTR